MIKKTLRWLQEWDGIWSIPFLFKLVLLSSAALLSHWGPTAGIFPPGLINAALIAAFYMFVGVTLVNLIMNLYHRGLYRYYYNKHSRTTTDKTEIKVDFKCLPTWLRVLIFPIYSLVYFFAYCWLVAQLM